ncbi:hypothetical protein SAMN05421820_103325 [Pedobacter steynii]|uniref:Uncharacterized protein n=1 Tax=Pedobacter steynii TaxID=430522 RepID=A0A1G9RQX4_9SPHI|nr:hypothetical protein [Pedobacter steynii]NQX37680.1 hypothetical protein [Pedobacter steynii]SDM25572.1 hypothetical protein SAMN05421820_103325 [Pedobacter steynii]
MENKRKRKRINFAEKQGEIIIDIESFIKNKSSENVKKVQSVKEEIEIDIYFDKHYYLRNQVGDQNGKRDGIGYDFVESTLMKATKHLIYYALKIKSFTFINFEEGFKQRMILTQHFNDDSDDLNIVVEYHYLSMHKYEVTVITALRKNDFYFNDGSYQIELQEDDTSNLNKKEMNKVKKTSSFNGI